MARHIRLPALALSAATALLLCSLSVDASLHSVNNSTRHLLADQQQQGNEQQQQQQQREGWWWLAKLEPITLLRSHRPRKPLDISIAMPFSLDRFDALDIMCTYAWPGVVSAAVYIPMYQGVVYMPNFEEYHEKELAEVLRKVSAFHRQFHGDNAKGNCTLDMSIYIENMPETSDWYTYPTNAMRNLALETARTDIVLLLDADFLVGPYSWAAELMRDEAKYKSVLQLLQRKAVLVAPAFKDPDNNDVLPYDQSQALVRDVILSNSKGFVLRKWDEGLLQPFLFPHHADTDYDKWRSATEIYPVPYAEKGRAGDGSPVYEPYVLAYRKDLPQYDERFRGFFKNKVSYLFYLNELGFKFHVSPEAYVVHYPHIKQDIFGQMQSEKHQMMMNIWYGHMPDELKKGIYKPVVAPKPQRPSKQLLEILRSKRAARGRMPAS